MPATNYFTKNVGGYLTLASLLKSFWLRILDTDKNAQIAASLLQGFCLAVIVGISGCELQEKIQENNRNHRKKLEVITSRN